MEEAKMADKPTCRACGKPLRKLTRSCDRVPAVEATTFADALAYLVAHPELRKPFDDETPIAVTRINRNIWDASLVDVSYWSGLWGSYGDDRFCGLTCGWQWACRNCPK
jgi:hypothetical protein